ncbi:uncharacterized protein BO96DRAFT_376113 [Aspergillus niger CBS 101883]|uniref:Uncharacterized protein n=2 Tax=Aspergillus niger TaxID=5061 RepID=A2QA53_ASPNC|nr:uncharacterized protein BO96DRAFT_376113 [Aspergillus niger CBS 101883]XP_059599741.1 hypothetical protein An01g10230 [Aspergillus niger]PYH52120.1 hypothetical protein BO96DRAFT_376113 [Aspergillus niger CBS 101883]CAK37205.1 hypothetical protein An01g10230 [Aspergillus niger]
MDESTLSSSRRAVDLGGVVAVERNIPGPRGSIALTPAKHPLKARIPMVTILHVNGNIRTIFATFTVVRSSAHGPDLTHREEAKAVIDRSWCSPGCKQSRKLFGIRGRVSQISPWTVLLLTDVSNLNPAKVPSLACSSSYWFSTGGLRMVACSLVKGEGLRVQIIVGGCLGAYRKRLPSQSAGLTSAQ